MKSKQITVYVTDCGRNYRTKKTATNHEAVCVCWTNPKYKTCKTCAFSEKVHDSNGMEHEPHLLQTWVNQGCTNPLFNYNMHFHAAHKNAPALNINCTLWQPKTKKL